MNDPTKATLSAPRSIVVPRFAPPAKATQPGTKNKLDTLDGRLDHSVSGVDPLRRTTAVWVAHCIAGGAGAAIAWYELDPVQGRLLQHGLVADPRLDVFNPAISTDRTVNPLGSAHGSAMVLSLTTSSATTFPTAGMVSKIGDGPQSAIVAVHASLVSDRDFSCQPGNVCRWGDYGGATPDPAAPMSGSVGRVWCTSAWVRMIGNQGSWNWEATP